MSIHSLHVIVEWGYTYAAILLLFMISVFVLKGLFILIMKNLFSNLSFFF